jgi:hypothetical protein
MRGRSGHHESEASVLPAKHGKRVNEEHGGEFHLREALLMGRSDPVLINGPGFFTSSW